MIGTEYYFRKATDVGIFAVDKSYKGENESHYHTIRWKKCRIKYIIINFHKNK